MIVFHIETGELDQVDAGELSNLGSGYSGNGEDLDNPAATPIHDHGPIPVGFYLIGDPVDRAHTGPFSVPLVADLGNLEWDRGSFYVHGGLAGEPNTAPSSSSDTRPRTASDGCIVAARPLREAIARHQILQVAP